MSAQAVSHQENSWEQKFAPCSGLDFPILPAGAGAGRGRAALAAELLLEAPAGRLEAQSHRGPLLGRQTHRLWEWSTGALPGPDLPWPPSPRLCSWGLERWGPQDQGAARQTLSGATRRCEMRLQAQLMEPVRETAHTRCPTEATTFRHRAANATKGRALSPGPHPEDGEGEAGYMRTAP